MNRLLKQILSFLLTSGIGWILDFSCYTCLTYFFNLDVSLANMISAVPAFSFVFFTSRKRIFTQNESGRSLGAKYMIYFVYQILLVVSVSFLGQFLFDYMIGADWRLPVLISRNLKLVVKIVITPITMCLNFIVMKVLQERI